MRVVLLSPNIDATDVGEAFVAYKWAEMLEERVELTVIAMQRQGRPALAEQLTRTEVVTWTEPAWLACNERLNAMMKPLYPYYYWRARNWLRKSLASGRQFDILHQLMPLAARYPSAATGLGVPSIIGPVGGTLENPEPLRHELGSNPIYTRLRKLDRFRFAYDPWLRRSYTNADLILGVAPYMRKLLEDIPIARYEDFLELGIDPAPEKPPKVHSPGKIKLLHVGRGVRTKGLRDSVRCLAYLKDIPGLSLNSAGGGEEIEACRSEAERLGVNHMVTFAGRVSRERVQEMYETADIFLFPSFREPTGGVLYEAMQAGLPVVTCAYGGPDYIIDSTCGIKVAPAEPQEYAKNIADAVRRLALDGELRVRLGRGARQKVILEGAWSAKAEKILKLYSEVRQVQSSSVR